MPSRLTRTYKGLQALSLIVGIVVGIGGLYVGLTASSVNHVYLVPLFNNQVATGGSVTTSTITISTGVSTMTSTLSSVLKVLTLTSANLTSTNVGSLLVANVSGYATLVIYPPENAVNYPHIYFATSKTGSYYLGNDCTGGANPQQCVGIPGQSLGVPEGEGLWIGIDQIPQGTNITIVETV